MSFQAAVKMQSNSVQIVSDVNFSHDMTLRDIERSVILETLRRQRYNRTRTARVLGIGIRTLQRKIKLYRDVDNGMVIDFPRKEI